MACCRCHKLVTKAQKVEGMAYPLGSFAAEGKACFEGCTLSACCTQVVSGRRVDHRYFERREPIRRGALTQALLKNVSDGGRNKFQVILKISGKNQVLPMGLPAFFPCLDDIRILLESNRRLSERKWVLFNRCENDLLVALQLGSSVSKCRTLLLDCCKDNFFAVL
jgi:hypothetical protein